MPGIGRFDLGAAGGAAVAATVALADSAWLAEASSEMSSGIMEMSERSSAGESECGGGNLVIVLIRGQGKGRGGCKDWLGGMPNHCAGFLPFTAVTGPVGRLLVCLTAPLHPGYNTTHQAILC